MILNNLVYRLSKVIDKPVCNIIDFQYCVYKYDSDKKDFVTSTIKIQFNKESGIGFRVFEEYTDHIEHDKEYFKFEHAFRDFVNRCSKFSDKFINER